ncbi:MAG: carboxypeptidase-like regulatory domain-containing protein, partial [Terracidiphilus sp.]
MPRRRPGYISVLYALAILASSCLAAASEYHGQVTYGGLPVPGATITATQGAKKFTTTSDQGGVYNFDDLSDGRWKIVVEMQCFAKIEADVEVTPNMASAKFELTVLPMDELMARTKLAQVPPVIQPTLVTPEVRKTDGSATANGAAEIPKAPDEQSQQANDGFLVNGSVNNAATSQYSLDRAFGNRRPNGKSLYNGGFMAIIGNSALNARTYSLSGLESPKPFYNLITGAFTVGGLVKIPRLLPRGPNFFAAYQWTRNETAQNETGLVPTGAERTGDLSGLLNPLGQPVTFVNPFTGLPFANNQVPISSQA